MTPRAVGGILAGASAVTQAVGASTSSGLFRWSLGLGVVVILVVAGLVWVIRGRRNASAPVERLGLPSLAGGPFALAPGPPDDAHAAVDPAHEGEDERSGSPAWSRWPFAAATTTHDHERAEDLARILAEALRGMGPEPSCAETDRLAEQTALIIVSDLRDDLDLDLNAGVALLASISDELAYELRRLVRASP